METKSPSGPDSNPDPGSRHRAAIINQGRALASLLSGKSARGGYIAAVDQGLISATNFLATIILARTVTPTELGIYAVGFTTLRLIRTIQDGLIFQPLNAYGAPMGAERFKRYATGTSIIQIGFALLVALGLALCGYLLIETGNDTAGPTVYALWAPALFWQMQEYLRRMLYARGRVLDATLNTLIASVFRLGILGYWAVGGQLSGTAGLYAIGFGALIALPPGVWQTRGYWSRRFSELGLVFVRNWRYGKWVAGGNILTWLSVEFYPVLTAGLINFAAAGAYRALQNLVAPIHTLLRAIDTYMTPRTARAYRERGISALTRMLRLTYLVAGIPTLGLLVFGFFFRGELLKLFYGDLYLEYTPGVILMVAFYALLFLQWPLQIVLKAARHSQPIFYASIVAAVVMATVGILLINQWGVYGTIAGQALNGLITTLILTVAWLRFRGRGSPALNEAGGGADARPSPPSSDRQR